MEPVYAAPPLHRLLDLGADAVAAVQAGRSLTDALDRIDGALRPGVQALSFHALRRLGAASEARALLAPKNPPPRVDSLLLTALALLWPDGAAPYAEHTLVDQAVAAARKRTPAAAGFVNAVLRRFLREREAVVEVVMKSPLAAWNHPPWWIDRVRDDWPQHWQALLRAANHHPPMTLRVNARQGGARAYVDRLRAQGRSAALVGPTGTEAEGAYADAAADADAEAEAEAEAGAQLAAGLATALRAAPAAVRAEPPLVLAQPCPVTQLPGFADGEVSVQDAAAQLAAPLLLGGAGGTPPLRAGARVLDACAAPGGKTAHLLELADLDLTALDSDARRLERVRQTLDRLRLPAEPAAPVTLLAADARDPGAWWDGRPFDAILLDAPCSASGIVRRHPDVRWLRRPGDIAALARMQDELLDALWPLLAPGGRLLYATCSIFRAEGQQRIDAFLQRRPAGSVRLDPASPGHLLPLPDNGAQVPEAGAAALSDGFFYALMHTN